MIINTLQKQASRLPKPVGNRDALHNPFTFSLFHFFTFSSIAFGLHESCHSTTGVPSALNVIGSQM